MASVIRGSGFYGDGSNLTGITAGLGADQTWSDLASSRSLNTTYTNTTGKTIAVLVHVKDYRSGQHGYASAYINGVFVGHTGGYNNTYTRPTSICMIVPNGHTYQVNRYESSYDTSYNWAELR